MFRWTCNNNTMINKIINFFKNLLNIEEQDPHLVLYETPNHCDEHPNGKGKTMAVWTVVSQHAKSKGINRHYCQPCAVWVSIWPDGSHWPLTEQAEFLVKQEEINHGV